MTVLTGDTLSYRTGRADKPSATHRLTGLVARNHAVLSASLRAGFAYDAARSAAARRSVVEQFQAELAR
jgi:hypothetical protein